MNYYIGFNQGQYGDLFISLTAARVLKLIDPACKLIFGINKKYKDVSKIFRLSDDIDDIVIWDGYDNWPTQKDKFLIEELKLKYDKVDIFNPMPQHVVADWYNYWHQTEEFCVMHKLPRPSKDLQDFKLNTLKVNQGNYICISPFTSFGSIKNLTKDIIHQAKEFCKNNSLELIQLGGPDDPSIEGVQKFKGNYYDSIVKMLGSKALISADTGMVWAASAFSHPTLAFYATSFYKNAQSSKNWTPLNHNQISFEANHVSNIKISISQSLNKLMKQKTYSKEHQDLFAKKIIGNKGFFLDIGCRTPVYENNTKILEESGWDGMMFDLDLKFIKECQEQRVAKSFCIDVSSKEFIEILNNNKCPQVIDYISMDVDDASFPCLKNILNSGFEFKCMTFEHTWDLKDPEKQTCVRESRELLKSLGYICLFEDVCLDYGEHAGKPFEDWWVNPLLEVNIEPQKHLTDKKIIALLNDK